MCRERFPKHCNSRKEFDMLYYAAMFILFGLIAWVLNLTGVATVATQSSWTLLASGIVLLMIHLAVGRTVRVS
jgi:uncharacterized membrane protein YtjA (UPF0391 family)